MEISNLTLGRKNRRIFPVVVQSERFFDVSEKNMENTQKRGQKGHSEAFSDPWLAQASLWLAWAPRRLRGEVTSSPWRARLLQVEATACLGKLLFNLLPSFPINRREGAEGMGSDFQTLKDLVKLRRRRIQIEAKALPNRVRDRFLHRSSSVLHSSSA